MDDRWTAAAALVDRSRRALYDYVRRAGHPVTREEAAQATGVSRALAAFHLDKLVEVGLLRARYEPPPHRRRTRGRTPKVYEPAPERLDARDGLVITIPERRYRLMAEILADAVAQHPADAGRAAREHAHQRGRDLGRRLREQAAGEVSEVLSELGFEPAPAPEGEVLLHNCPFHALATRHTALVCGLNHALLTGLLAGLGVDRVRADLVPRPDACCVTLRPAAEPGQAAESSG